MPSLTKYGQFSEVYQLYYMAAGDNSSFGGGKGWVWHSYYANKYPKLISGLTNLTAASPSEVEEYYALNAAYAEFLDYRYRKRSITKSNFYQERILQILLQVIRLLIHLELALCLPRLHLRLRSNWTIHNHI